MHADAAVVADLIGCRQSQRGCGSAGASLPMKSTMLMTALTPGSLFSSSVAFEDASGCVVGIGQDAAEFQSAAAAS